MGHHENVSGRCSQCLEILNRYPGFHPYLLTWFQEVQARNPDLHTSYGGRGKIDQEECFQRKVTKAHYGESAHNYNCALDGFQLKDERSVWDQAYFDRVIGENLTPQLKWYGASGVVEQFRELPHIELSNWKALARVGYVTLVDGPQATLKVEALSLLPHTNSKGDSSMDISKAGLDAAVDAVCDAIKVLKEKKALLQEGVDLVAAVAVDQDLKDNLSKLIAAGFSGILADAKSLGVAGAIELGVEEIPAIIEKVKAALA